MIDLYTWPTPNGHKVHIMLEETGLDYTAHAINIGEGDQFKPDFLKISPNNKMPAIVDQDGPDGKQISVFESGAILMYLAEKTGKFMPTDRRQFYDVLQWAMFQMASVGPMFGQASHFRRMAPDNTYGIERYSNEAGRIYGVMERRLAETQYLGGDDYTIADMLTWPWCRHPESQGQKADHADFPNVKRWFNAIAARPAVHKGIQVLADASSSAPMSDEAKELLYGKGQYQRR